MNEKYTYVEATKHAGCSLIHDVWSVWDVESPVTIRYWCCKSLQRHSLSHLTYKRHKQVGNNLLLPLISHASARKVGYRHTWAQDQPPRTTEELTVVWKDCNMNSTPWYLSTSSQLRRRTWYFPRINAGNLVCSGSGSGHVDLPTRMTAQQDAARWLTPSSLSAKPCIFISRLRCKRRPVRHSAVASVFVSCQVGHPSPSVLHHHMSP